MNDVVSQAFTADQLDALVDKAGGAGQVLRILAGEVEIALVPMADAPGTAASFAVEVPVVPGFEARVAGGDYGWRHEALTEEAFPVTPDQHGDREQKLFHFNCSLSSEEAAQRIRDAGYAPAAIGDILAFAERFPEVQRRHPVVGLGSIAEVEGKLSAPTLWFDGARRTLDLLWLDGDWHRNYRFLGARPRR